MTNDHKEGCQCPNCVYHKLLDLPDDIALKISTEDQMAEKMSQVEHCTECRKQTDPSNLNYIFYYSNMLQMEVYGFLCDTCRDLYG